MKIPNAGKIKKQPRRKKFLGIGSWNIGSWKTKDQEIMWELSNINNDVYVQSPKIKKGKGIIPCNDYIMLFRDFDEDKRGMEDVDILIHKKIEQSILNYRYVQNELWY